MTKGTELKLWDFLHLGFLDFYDDFWIYVLTDLAMAMAENKKVKNDIPLKKEPSLIRVKIPVSRMLKIWKLC